VSKTVKVRLVPKIDFSSGVPDKYKTVVVIPAIINSQEKVKKLMRNLEVYYCGNNDKNIYFALLSDFEDNDEEYSDKDKKIVECGLECTSKLNEKYGNKFFFLSRKRIYNEKMGVYMGRERKRGKLLEFMALLRDNPNNTFDVISSPIDEIKDSKYVITLDEDTFMPRDTAYKLIGAMSHILNVPKVDNNHMVVRGYSIMQPKVSISMEAKNATRFSQIFGGDSGVDGYSTAYSDTYEDLFGEGSFVGKGIIDIDNFYTITTKSIGENKILSHDLLEGSLTRCALVTDVELVDGYPSHYEGSCKRLYRWTRGDWQLIGWLFSKKISTLNKWKIFDNLRRSLLAPGLLLLLMTSIVIFNGNKQISLLCFLVLIMPLVFTVTDFVVTPKNKLMGAFKTFEQIVLILSFIPYESLLMIKAIGITLFRVIISKKNLLEWKASQIADRSYRNDFESYLKRMWIGPLIGILFMTISLNKSIGVSIYTLLPSALWILSPYIAFYISRDLKEEKVELNEEEKEYLRKLTRRIYAYYDDFVNKENNYLAPDNYQEKPFKGVAHRTSPTNIGMGLIADIAAYDMGYITLMGLVDKIGLTLDNMNTLEKIHGHYLNWYDTRTKEPLYPRYISTVDNGNLLANLWILKETMKELKTKPLIRIEEIISINDIYRIIEEEDSKFKIELLNNISIKEYLPILEGILINMNSIDDK
ncbi:MAG: glycosyl transferase, partial [Clostridium sp.]